MVPRTPRRSTIVAIGAGGLALSLALAGCSAGGDSGSSDGAVCLTYLVDNGEATVATAEALVDAFTGREPRHHGRGRDASAGRRRRQPGQDAPRHRRDGRRLRLQLGLALAGAQPRRRPSSTSPTRRGSTSSTRSSSRSSRPTTACTARRWGSRWPAPCCTTRTSTRELGLEIPTTWDEFIAQQRGDQGGRHRRPDRADLRRHLDRPALRARRLQQRHSPRTRTGPRSTRNNEAKYVDEPAFAGFEHLQEAFEKGLFNEDFASATYADGVTMLATGEGAQYPMLTFADRDQLMHDEPRRGRRRRRLRRCRPRRGDERPDDVDAERPSTSRSRPRATSSRRRRSSSRSSNSPEGCDVQNERRRARRARTSSRAASCPTTCRRWSPTCSRTSTTARRTLGARVPLAHQGPEPRADHASRSARASPRPRTVPRSTTRTSRSRPSSSGSRAGKPLDRPRGRAGRAGPAVNPEIDDDHRDGRRPRSTRRGTAPPSRPSAGA